MILVWTHTSKHHVCFLSSSTQPCCLQYKTYSPISLWLLEGYHWGHAIHWAQQVGDHYLMIDIGWWNQPGVYQIEIQEASTHPSPMGDIEQWRMNECSLSPGVPLQNLSLRPEPQSQCAGIIDKMVAWNRDHRNQLYLCGKPGTLLTILVHTLTKARCQGKL